ncbi:MAG: hypothetical protein UY12_C0006G0008 [Parcubacteria group bacterium GW2011_GWA2_47_8b]|uniref:Uncharacterized protein n=2 Tax=Parcubacteria group TaxID=1794811 RepID=A0A1G2FV40_9BACT|nr:MAG: hypothetical protein UY12_C0006G0008 [Parcubacteria group bacterium GW2011_GWA2_47_8b]OGY68357.1 MAG: hypothetical protein A2214_01290 [Candidatus Harrisonbacteria bacterium RIFOXYA1_FULL_48_8]OGZ41451.1 MAG: hypothetical protein A2W41_01510 [Candidatus Ryanbacteria bacterium RIFCSPHIGHO2_01_45_13]
MTVRRVFLILFLLVLISRAGLAVEIETSVPPNSANNLNQRLQEKEGQLLERERNLKYIWVGGGFLLALVILNYYLDYRRRKRDQNGC